MLYSSFYLSYFFFFFFFNDTATTEIYTLSLHDALPICVAVHQLLPVFSAGDAIGGAVRTTKGDRKSTRLNSSHRCISYAVFCLKKKKKKKKKQQQRRQCKKSTEQARNILNDKKHARREP